jgi:hypothetical protein
MEYAKLMNGKLTKCVILPNGLAILDGKIKRNPTEEEILSAGYLPIEEQTEPANKEGFVKSSKWVQTDTAIIKKWTVLPDRRPMSQTAVNKMLIAQQINTLTVDDNTALRMKQFYPTFDEIVGQKVKQGFKFRHGDDLWSVAQPELTILSHYVPGAGMESLYTKVNETHAGTLADPIPYDGNMALENGKHYSQNSTIYLCNRDTLNPVHNKLAELVGLYVVEV